VDCGGLEPRQYRDAVAIEEGGQTVARECQVCKHPDRDEIDLALVWGDSLRVIAKRYGVSKDSLHRHALNHVPESLRQAQDIREVARGDKLLERVEKLLSEAESLLQYGKDEQHAKAWADGLRECRACLELLARVTGKLDERPVINVLALPEWTALRSAILEALTPYPEGRQAVLEAIDAASD